MVPTKNEENGGQTGGFLPCMLMVSIIILGEPVVILSSVFIILRKEKN